MYLKKSGHPLPKIKLKKSKGSIEWVTGLFFIFFLAVLLCAELQISIYRSASMYLEDALAASNLASAVMDIEEYGTSHTARISSPTEAYERYKNAVKENLQLDDKWECANLALISGQVKIEKYIIYNVEKEVVHIFVIEPNGNVSMSKGVLGKVKAPNGIEITNTSVYSEIAFPVKGLLGEIAQAYKGKLVDIVANVQVEEDSMNAWEEEKGRYDGEGKDNT